ncbi:MAG: PH domain-containing protein [Planctomycetes bacterium]|nr:PH domain-containing protein [Planctomycetota bacterium]
MAIVRPKPELLRLYLLYALFTVPAFPIVFLVLYFKYHTLKFRFDREGVGVSYGILFRREHYLTYARIQDIHLTRDLFERWLGIGSVEIQTASGGSGGDLAIVGTDQFEIIRDYLYIKMRGAHAHGTHPASGAEPQTNDQLIAALRETASALRETTRAIEESRQ